MNNARGVGSIRCKNVLREHAPECKSGKFVLRLLSNVHEEF